MKHHIFSCLGIAKFTQFKSLICILHTENKIEIVFVKKRCFIQLTNLSTQYFTKITVYVIKSCIL